MSASRDITTSDRYTDAATLPAPDSVRVNLLVRSAAIYWQAGEGKGAMPAWDNPEERLEPGFFSFDRNLDAVRVRSATAGSPAKVSIATRTPGEVS